VVLGSGAVALAHALFQSRYGPVVLAGSPPVAAVPAVERVPAPLLTLLLELGIVPAELDVDCLTRDSLVAWEQSVPTERRGPACAHVDRSALVGALWRRVQACPDVQVVAPLRTAEVTAKRLVDATGRRALTAARRAHPTPVWVATCCSVARGDLDPTMRLAASSTGYAFRLGSARWLTVGWVGPGAPPPNSAAVCDRLVDGGAGWLLEDVDLAEAQVVRRVASVADAAPSDDARVLALGDAALGRDALASQGMAIGLSDARRAAGPDGDRGREALSSRHRDGLERHLRHLAGTLDACHHHRAPAWLTYRRWVDERRAGRLASEV
jgi:2-polyprenyl-6-methoxyphenol hydroxylase-like FAD-dependent oxidoreductase